jgi:hypothetical protein
MGHTSLRVQQSCSTRKETRSRLISPESRSVDVGLHPTNHSAMAPTAKLDFKPRPQLTPKALSKQVFHEMVPRASDKLQESPIKCLRRVASKTHDQNFLR